MRKQIDERDTMFARATYEKGSPTYEDYYTRNPQKQEVDDKIREKPQLCSEGTAMYDQEIAPMASSAFHFLSDIHHLCEGPVAKEQIVTDPSRMTKRLKGMARQYGACLVGVTKLKPDHFYSHRGRHAKDYGQLVESDHTYGIVFAAPMNQELMNRAPMIPEIVETSKVYVDVAIMGMVISYYIRSLGYDARNHMDANYLVNTVAVAHDAGLGQVGRNGMLTSKEYGSLIRLGVVTTTLPLEEDHPVDFGLEAFCKLCNRCSNTCFAKAISHEADEATWCTHQELCYSKWRDVGTDCGMCLTTCPFSQKLPEIQEVTDFADNQEAIQKVLDAYTQQYGMRAFNPKAPDWLEKTPPLEK